MAEVMELAIYPFLDMNITQRHDQGNHLPHWQGSTNYSDKPWDEACADSGRSYFVPQNEFIVEQVLGIDPDQTTNSVRLKSVSKLKMPYQQQPDYLCLTLTHMNEDNLRQVSVGQIIHRGERILMEGTDGIATGNHFHITANLGNYYGFKKNSNGSWCFVYDTSLTPEQAFYVDTDITNIRNFNSYSFQSGKALTWISRDGYLNQEEMENNAQIVISYYRSMGYNDSTIAAILGNMQAESTLSPELNEVGGGGGYGLVQWTPKSVLINHASYLGYSDYQNGDTQLKVIIQEMIGNASIREWYSTEAFISNYYLSGATRDMIGLTANDFLYNTMNWSPEKLAIAFMVCYERPSYNPNINHFMQRQRNAYNWLEYINGGAIPPIPGLGFKRGYNFVLFNRRRREKNLWIRTHS